MVGVSWEHAYSTAGRPWRPDTPVFLPYLAEERWEPGRTGCFAGLTLAHTRDDLLRAALEGVAFLIRDRLGDLRAAGHDPARVLLGGGGAGHAAWRQLLADVLGLPLYPAARGDSTWLSPAGAAMLAAAAGGEMLPGEPARDRSDDDVAAPVAPRQLGAASSGYGRYLDLKSTQGYWPRSSAV